MDELLTKDVDLGCRHGQLESGFDGVLIDLEHEPRPRTETGATEHNGVRLRGGQRRRLHVDSRQRQTRAKRSGPRERARDELRPPRGVEVPRRDDQRLRR